MQQHKKISVIPAQYLRQSKHAAPASMPQEPEEGWYGSAVIESDGWDTMLEEV